MPAWRWLLAGLALALAAPAGALAPEPSVNVAATGTVEVIFSPWGDAEAALLKAIDDAGNRFWCRPIYSPANPWPGP
jgi:hypothetical protein